MTSKTLEQETKPDFKLCGLSRIVTADEPQIRHKARIYDPKVHGDGYGCLLCPGDCALACEEHGPGYVR